MMLGLPALLAVPSDVRRYPTIANHRRYCFKRLQSERIYLSTTSKGHRISSVLWIRRIDWVTPTNSGQESGVPPLDSVPRSGRLSDHVKKRLGACFSTVIYRQMLHPGRPRSLGPASLAARGFSGLYQLNFLTPSPPTPFAPAACSTFNSPNGNVALTVRASSSDTAPPLPSKNDPGGL